MTEHKCDSTCHHTLATRLPVLPDSTLREQVARALYECEGWSSMDGPIPYVPNDATVWLEQADVLMPLFARVSAEAEKENTDKLLDQGWVGPRESERLLAEAEKRGAAKGWDAGFEAGGRFALSRGGQEPLNPYTLTTETEQQ